MQYFEVYYTLIQKVENAGAALPQATNKPCGQAQWNGTGNSAGCVCTAKYQDEAYRRRALTLKSKARDTTVKNDVASSTDRNEFGRISVRIGIFQSKVRDTKLLQHSILVSVWDIRIIHV